MTAKEEMKKKINEMSQNDKIQTLKDYFTKEFTDYLELGNMHTFFHPKNATEMRISLTNLVDLMKVFGGFIDPRRIGRFELVEVGNELGVRINHHIILEREKPPYTDRFCYLMFDVINYVVENLMDIDEVMMMVGLKKYRENIWLNERI